MKKQKKESEKMSESLAKKAKRAKSAYSAPSIATPADARLNPSPSITYKSTSTSAPAPQTDKKDRRRKTKGILFRMTPELYLELDRCAYTDRESKTITRILTRGAIAEIQRIRAKYPNGLETRPLDELSDSEKEFLG
jgi:hypothetical protein